MGATPFPDVNAVLGQLLPRMREALGDNLRAVYIFGSLVTGDFAPRLSDIDLAAIVARPLTQDELDRLERMHTSIEREFPAWHDRVEVGYLAQADVNPFDPGATIARIAPGEPFHTQVAEHSWLFNLAVVRERGITLMGPDPREVIGPISRDRLAAGLRQRMAEWRDYIDGELPPMDAGSQAYVVLTMCRALCTFTTGEWASKRPAAEWAATAEPAWASLIRQALAWREAAPAGPVDLAASQAQMLAFAREVTSWIAAGR
jgi:predicted nucleotidyltransferase